MVQFQECQCFQGFSRGISQVRQKVAGLIVWDSNHEACEIVNVPILKHLLAKRLITFYLQWLDLRVLVCYHLDII